MKKLLLPLLMMATLFACQSPETKTAETSADKESGTFTSLDEKSAKIKQLLEAYAKNDTSVGHELYVDTLQVKDRFANNQESDDNTTKVNPGGRAALLQGDTYVHALNTSITATTDENDIKTFVFADGRVVTAYWGTLVGMGKYTKAKNVIPVHLMFVWKGDKIVQLYRMFDAGPLKAEIAASQAK
jgi:hypothetical protein